jgi:ATP-binding cassette, subfamily C, bacterial CydD
MSQRTIKLSPEAIGHYKGTRLINLQDITEVIPPARLRKTLEDYARMVTRKYQLCTGLAGIDALAGIGFAYGLAQSLAAVVSGPPASAEIITGLIILTLALFVRAGTGYLNQTHSLDAARDIIKTIRLDLISDTLKSGGLGERQKGYFTTLFEDTEALEGYYARFRPIRVQAGFVPIIILIAVATQSVACALILLGALIPFITLMIVAGMASAEAARQQFVALARLSNLFADRIRAMALILSFDDAGRQSQRLGTAASSVANRTLGVLKVAFSSSAILEFFAALSVALVAVYCGFYLLNELPFPVPGWLDFTGNAYQGALFCLAVSVEIFAPLRRLSAAYHENQQAMAACERLMILRSHIETDERQPLSLSGPPAIEFNAVTVTFPDDPDYLIGPVSFSARAGSVIALTGPTGSGKSTLLRRLLSGGGENGPVLSGDILINGQKLNPEDNLTACIAWMSQTTPIIAGTLKDNLALACRSAGADDLQRVAEISGLRELMTSREGGFEHRLDERGSGLSGGERRRIGLARALLKPAPILILDEPTADLDPQSEADLLIRLKAAFAGRTVLMATHSAALLALADEVVAL